jgi:hypothetical protein
MHRLLLSVCSDGTAHREPSMAANLYRESPLSRFIAFSWEQYAVIVGGTNNSLQVPQ